MPKTIGKGCTILNAMRHSVSNVYAEALNSKIRPLRIKARYTATGSALNWGDVHLRKAEYGVLSLPTMIGEDAYNAAAVWGGVNLEFARRIQKQGSLR
jgi:hypothetical protein